MTVMDMMRLMMMMMMMMMMMIMMMIFGFYDEGCDHFLDFMTKVLIMIMVL